MTVTLEDGHTVLSLSHTYGMHSVANVLSVRRDNSDIQCRNCCLAHKYLKKSNQHQNVTIGYFNLLHESEKYCDLSFQLTKQVAIWLKLFEP